jgi:peptidoglycan L-alanyl-D-glutamate endopeptidase CwlK
MTYVLGAKSLAKLEGVHPDLVRVVRRAIAITTQDFAVFEGLRTLKTQREYMRRGVTRTLASKHLKQPDGFGHAVDLVPWIDGALRWEWGPIWHIAEAMRQAAIAEAVSLTWGGVWDQRLNDLGADLKAAVSAYSARHPGPDFLDGPHFQLD